MGTFKRRLPAGAETEADGGVHFRVWAPLRKQVTVVLESGPGAPAAVELRRDPGKDGYFSALCPAAGVGTLYRYQLDGDATKYPDPASRYQPGGPHGSSQVIDAGAFAWTDQNWKGPARDAQVIYEMHIGTFTPEGTWQSAKGQLGELAETGITMLEVMPVADFPGRFGWGYDGVGLFAPSWLYGQPDDMRSFVNEAHALGIAVILDVVYNHLGPDGNYLPTFSPWYLSKKYKTDWGEGINFDGEHSAQVREFFVSNARYWIEEFHLDGLRLDATQEIRDESPRHILADISRAARSAAGGRRIFLVAENETQHTILARPEKSGGYGLDALWNDDFHHSAMVALTGRNEAYYSDYLGHAQEFVSAAKYGYLYQGQWYKWQSQPRGTPSFDLPCTAFVNFIQNHDQVANSARGERPNTLVAKGKYRAMTALLLLAPGTPMLFQGQEFGATTPFLFFGDHNPELAKLVREGRGKFLSQFPSLAVPEVQAILPDPGSSETFEISKLDLSERKKNAEAYRLHKDLIALRRTDPVFSRSQGGSIDGAVLSPDAFVLRYFSPSDGDRLMIVNLGTDLSLSPISEPLIAPPFGRAWRIIWSSEEPEYGGLGTCPPNFDANWRIPGSATIVLAAEVGV